MGFDINSEILTKLDYKEVALIAVAMGNYQENFGGMNKELLNRSRNLVNRLGNEMYDVNNKVPQVDKLLDVSISNKELMNLLLHFKVSNQIKKVRIKRNFKDILYNIHEYDEKDDSFFDEYSNKEVVVYKYSNNINCKDWFILEENNHPITIECFDEC